MTKTPLQSPWSSLPTTPLYILPEDFTEISLHKNYPNLRLDMMPGQLIGGLDNAEVVFLLLNPGFNESDIIDLQLPGFMEDVRQNHINPYDSPFYVFNEGYERTKIHQWWARILEPVIQAGVSESTLRTKAMAIEYFPYHSVKYRSIGSIPSQHFAFELVREAIQRKKTIVIMRSPKLWLKAVPELADYPYMKLNSWLNVIVSPRNIGEENFNTILAKLTK